jgi:hypothetical protein
MMTNPRIDFIAGWKTAEDWRAAKKKLIIGGDPDNWRQVCDDFYKTRLDLRYLNPSNFCKSMARFKAKASQ